MIEDIDRKIVTAALALAASNGWAKVTLPQIAAEAGVTLADLYRRAPTKHAVLCRLAQYINQAVLTNAAPDAGETPRERLFEVLMNRFDAMQPFKPGLKAIAADFPRDPGSAGLIALLLPHSMGWMLQAAGIALTGFAAPLKVLALSGIYLKVLHTWLDDASEDNAKTMAELDRLLKQAEGWANSLP